MVVLMTLPKKLTIWRCNSCEAVGFLEGRLLESHAAQTGHYLYTLENGEPYSYGGDTIDMKKALEAQDPQGEKKARVR